MYIKISTGGVSGILFLPLKLWIRCLWRGLIQGHWSQAPPVFKTWSTTLNKNGHLGCFQRIKSVSYFLLPADQKIQTGRYAALTLVKVAWVRESCREQFPIWRQAILPYLKGEMNNSHHCLVFIVIDFLFHRISRPHYATGTFCQTFKMSVEYII